MPCSLTRCRPFLAGILLLLQCVAPLAAADRELLETVLRSAAHCRRFDTYYADSVWNTEDETGVRFVRTMVSRSGDGRARCRIEQGSGAWSPDSKVERWHEFIDNGQVVAFVEEPSFDAKSELARSNPPLSVTISATSGKVSVLEPLELNHFAPKLRAAMEGGGTITTDEQASGLLRIEWARDDLATDPKYLFTNSATIDLSHGCPTVNVFEVRSGDGKVASHEETEYRSDPSGLMIPVRSVLTRTRPQLNRTYQLLEARINDPRDFPDEIFHLSFPAGTLVKDQRFQVEYRLASKTPIDDQLLELAQANQQDDPAEASAKTPEDSIWRRFPYFTLGLGGAVLLIAAVMRYRIRRGNSSSPP